MSVKKRPGCPETSAGPSWRSIRRRAVNGALSLRFGVARWIHRAPLREIARASHSTSLRLISTALTLVFGILGAQLLGAEIFGSYVSLFTVAGLLATATSTGLPGLLQREVSASRGSGDRGALKPLVQGLIAINGALALGLVGALLIGAVTAAVILSFCIVSNAAGIVGAIFIAHERVLVAQWIGNVLRPLGALLTLLVFAALTTPTPLLPLFAQLTGVALAFAALMVLWRGEPMSNVARAVHAAWWSDRHAPLLRAGVIFAGTQVLINLTTQVDILILTVLAEPDDVAHYYAAVRAAMVINFFFGASGLLAEPALTRLHASGDRDKVQALATSTAWTGAIVTVGAALCAVFVAPYYLRLYGPDFIVALPSFIVFTSGLVVRSLFGPALPLLRATRLEWYLLRITAAVLVLNAGMTFALIPIFGLVGAAMGSAIQFALYGALMLRTVWTRNGIRSDIFVSFRRPAARHGLL